MALPVAKVSLREYLDGEERSGRKHEFLDDEVFEMEAATLSHQSICLNLARRAAEALEGTGCSAHLAPRTATSAHGLYTYPDLVIVCGRLATLPADPNTLINPRVIFEVLSPSTEDYDRGRKFDRYLQIPTFTEYICIEQHQHRVLHQYRHADGTWITRFLTTPEAILALESVPLHIPLAHIYQNIEFPPPAA